MASSLALTPPPKVGMLNSLPFSDILLTLICWRFSRFISSALLLADLFATDRSRPFDPCRDKRKPA